MTKKLKAFLATYPGKIDEPVDLHVASLEAFPAGTQYGDIVCFPLVKDEPQRGDMGWVIHPEQKFRLVP